MLTSFVVRKDSFQADLARPELAKALWDKESLIWVDLEDPTEFESDVLVELFNFHPLAVEDCLTDTGEPKLDDYDEYLFLVVHAIKKGEDGELKTLELDMFVNQHYLVTFHKTPVLSVQRVLEEVRRKNGSPLTEGTDLLLHAILDRLVDNYHPVITEHERRIDVIEEHLFDQRDDQFLRQVLKAQKEILFLKRLMNPQRETISHLTRSVKSFVKPQNVIYFRDICDHLFQYHQMAEELNGMLNGIMQIHFSHVSHRLNQVIKTMTILATLALPLMVISGIYGMNFRWMPELEWQYGYFYSLGLMVFVSIFLILWMKLKKWF